VARAKRTDRAEARRRYRQAMAEAEGQDGDGVETALGAPATSDRSGPQKEHRPLPQTGAQTPPSRLSLLDSLRWAFQPADIRGDLALLPWLVTRTKAIWVPALLTVASALAFLFLGPQENALALLGFQAFVVPPPMAAAFLAGLLTPRAAWLAGGITGLIAAIVYVAVVFAYPDTSAATSAGPAARQNAALFALLVSPTVGLAVGAFAGFYRRFLRAANPNPQRQTKGQRRSSSRSDARR
jgi:F0F1-type ATP synthase assembly protein I